jgi:hypothetical protein
MKNKDEELIQEFIERKLKGLEEIDWSPDGQEDIDAYEILFQELSNETDVAGDFTLAEKVIGQIDRKHHKVESVKYAALILVISTVFLLITSLSIMFVDAGYIKAVLNLATTHNGVILFMVLSLIGIQVLDKVFVKKGAQLLPI